MSRGSKVVVLGGGGQAKVVIASLLAAEFEVVGVLDDNSERWGSRLLGVPILGPIEKATEGLFEEGLVAIGDNAVRRSLAARIDLRWATLVHPKAIVHESVRIGVGTVIFAGAIVQPDVVLGQHVIVNTGAIIDHDCVVEDYAHVAPGTRLAGNVRVGAGAFLGVGASVIPGIRIGAWSVVGAGGVVIGDVADSTVVVGVPARRKP